MRVPRRVPLALAAGVRLLLRHRGWKDDELPVMGSFNNTIHEHESR